MKKLKGQPFALLGVNTDKIARLKKAKQRSQLNWRNFCDISPRGPISRAWGINAWPSIFVLDHKGAIRYKCLYDEELDDAIDKLIKEAKAESKK